jgi:hypothetical protein
MVKAILLILGGLLASSSAFGGAIVACSNFVNLSVSDLSGVPCFVGDKLFSNFNSSDPDEIFLGGVLTAGNSPGLTFFGDTTGRGLSGHPISSSPIDIEFTVSVIDPFPNTSTPNPQVISASTIATLLKVGAGTIGGTMKFCIGAEFDGNFMGDDGCAANGGTLLSAALGSGNSITLPPGVRTIDVWDQIALSGGAQFGTLGQTFSQALPAVPEPISPILIGSGLVMISTLLVSIRRTKSKTRE